MLGHHSCKNYIDGPSFHIPMLSSIEVSFTPPTTPLIALSPQSLGHPFRDDVAKYAILSYTTCWTTRRDLGSRSRTWTTMRTRKWSNIRWSLRSIRVGKMSPTPTTKKEASFMWHTLMTFITFIEHKLMIHVALLLLVGLFVLMMHTNFYRLLVY